MRFFFPLLICTACQYAEKMATPEEDNNPPIDTGTQSPEQQPDDSGDIQSDTEWGEIHDQPPGTFFAADLSQAVRDGVDYGLVKASEAWGNYGPLEYWVLGTDTDAGLALITQFCERRDAQGHWDKASCMQHHTNENSDHNFMSYLEIGQQVIATGQPMGSMGLNGNRDWGIHFFTSSYPFGFDGIFEYIYPEEEIKTLFHEYFHAVQASNIYSTDYDVRDEMMGPTWFVEGGAEYMANFTTSKLWESGEMTMSAGSGFSTFSQRMEWKMIGGLESIEQYCPNKTIADITYQDECSYAAYELGAWAHAYLQNQTSEHQLLDVFYPSLNELGWEGAFVNAFGMSSADFYIDFEVFLDLSLEEQMQILPEI